jgi:hypothetical protein
VVYFEPDMQFYYLEPFLTIYKPVSSERLQGLYRGLLLRSAAILKNTNAKLNPGFPIFALQDNVIDLSWSRMNKGFHLC